LRSTARYIQSKPPQSVDSDRLISNSMAMTFVAWNRILTRDHDGAKMAREGKKVMQLLEGGRYVAVVVDGKMKTYS
jgi:hypothetical protein